MLWGFILSKLAIFQRCVSSKKTTKKSLQNSRVHHAKRSVRISTKKIIKLFWKKDMPIKKKMRYKMLKNNNKKARKICCSTKPALSRTACHSSKSKVSRLTNFKLTTAGTQGVPFHTWTEHVCVLTSRSIFRDGHSVISGQEGWRLVIHILSKNSPHQYH